MENGMVLILLGAALAFLGGGWTAALLWTAAGLRRRGSRGGEDRPREQEELPAEELRRSAAMQEGFDNLMRYTVMTARDREGPREEL